MAARNSPRLSARGFPSASTASYRTRIGFHHGLSGFNPLELQYRALDEEHRHLTQRSNALSAEVARLQGLLDRKSDDETKHAAALAQLATITFVPHLQTPTPPRGNNVPTQQTSPASPTEAISFEAITQRQAWLVGQLAALEKVQADHAASINHHGSSAGAGGIDVVEQSAGIASQVEKSGSIDEQLSNASALRENKNPSDEGLELAKRGMTASSAIVSAAPHVESSSTEVSEKIEKKKSERLTWEQSLRPGDFVLVRVDDDRWVVATVETVSAYVNASGMPALKIAVNLGRTSRWFDASSPDLGKYTPRSHLPPIIKEALPLSPVVVSASKAAQVPANSPTFSSNDLSMPVQPQLKSDPNSPQPARMHTQKELRTVVLKDPDLVHVQRPETRTDAGELAVLAESLRISTIQTGHAKDAASRSSHTSASNEALHAPEQFQSLALPPQLPPGVASAAGSLLQADRSDRPEFAASSAKAAEDVAHSQELGNELSYMRRLLSVFLPPDRERLIALAHNLFVLEERTAALVAASQSMDYDDGAIVMQNIRAVTATVSGGTKMALLGALMTIENSICDELKSVSYIEPAVVPGLAARSSSGFRNLQLEEAVRPQAELRKNFPLENIRTGLLELLLRVRSLQMKTNPRAALSKFGEGILIPNSEKAAAPSASVSTSDSKPATPPAERWSPPLRPSRRDRERDLERERSPPRSLTHPNNQNDGELFVERIRSYDDLPVALMDGKAVQEGVDEVDVYDSLPGIEPIPLHRHRANVAQLSPGSRSLFRSAANRL